MSEPQPRTSSFTWRVLHSEIEMIHRATQWARDLDKDVLYLPHRVGGKLHVLKIENGFAAARSDEGEGHRGGSRNLEEHGRVVSVEFFVKGDLARYARSFRFLREVSLSALAPEALH